MPFSSHQIPEWGDVNVHFGPSLDETGALGPNSLSFLFRVGEADEG